MSCFFCLHCGLLILLLPLFLHFLGFCPLWLDQNSKWPLWLIPFGFLGLSRLVVIESWSRWFEPCNTLFFFFLSTDNTIIFNPDLWVVRRLFFFFALSLLLNESNCNYLFVALFRITFQLNHFHKQLPTQRASSRSFQQSYCALVTQASMTTV